MEQEQLNKIGNEIRTQDNRITADPLFCVFEKQQICGMDGDYSSFYEWYNSDNDDVMDADDMTEDEAEEKGYRAVYSIEIDRFVNAHFTEKAADHFIKINRHNLRKPFTYVTSLWRCAEMIDIRNYLKAQGGEREA